MELFTKLRKLIGVALVGIGFLYFGIRALVKDYNLRETLNAQSEIVEGEISSINTNFYGTGRGMFREYVWITFKNRKDTLFSDNLNQRYQKENGYLASVTSVLKVGQKLKVLRVKNGSAYDNIVEVYSGEQEYLTIDDIKPFSENKELIYITLGVGSLFTILLIGLLFAIKKEGL